MSRLLLLLRLRLLLLLLDFSGFFFFFGIFLLIIINLFIVDLDSRKSSYARIGKLYKKFELSMTLRT